MTLKGLQNRNIYKDLIFYFFMERTYIRRHEGQKWTTQHTVEDLEGARLVKKISEFYSKPNEAAYILESRIDSLTGDVKMENGKTMSLEKFYSLEENAYQKISKGNKKDNDLLYMNFPDSDVKKAKSEFRQKQGLSEHRWS